MLFTFLTCLTHSLISQTSNSLSSVLMSPFAGLPLRLRLEISQLNFMSALCLILGFPSHWSHCEKKQRLWTDNIVKSLGQHICWLSETQPTAILHFHSNFVLVSDSYTTHESNLVFTFNLFNWHFGPKLIILTR